MRFADDDLLIEVTRYGTWLRVAALHAGSGRETVVHAPAKAPLAGLVALARRRLQRRRPPRPVAPERDRLA